MPAKYPDFNDREFDLVKKIANNTALLADEEIGDVASVAGTTGQVLVNGSTTPKTGAVTLSLPPLLVLGDVTGTNAGGLLFSDTYLFRNSAGSLTLQGNTGQFKILSAIGTNAAYCRLSNTGGDYFIGAESSAGGAILTGSSAYALVLVAPAGKALQLGTNGALRMTISSAGDVTLTGSLGLGNAYVATPQVSTGYVTIKDSTGTIYKVLVAP